MGATSFGDDNMTSVMVDHISGGGSGEEARNVIGNSCQLRRLAIEGKSMEWGADPQALQWFRGLCAGVARNCLLGRLSLREYGLGTAPAVGAVRTLSPFMRLNTLLRRLEIVVCVLGDEGAGLLAAALARREGQASLWWGVLDTSGVGNGAGWALVDAVR